MNQRVLRHLVASSERRLRHTIADTRTHVAARLHQHAGPLVFAVYRVPLMRHDAALQFDLNHLFDEVYVLNFLDNGTVASGADGTPRQSKLSLRLSF
jgi:hypothetical protein